MCFIRFTVTALITLLEFPTVSIVAIIVIVNGSVYEELTGELYTSK